ncbi:helix-turn-helix domain-containing protein [Bacillus sp. UNC438CL73TsuS30]|uniref:helix-turn-helix domain-containing protein n=1 Tax=Bacillus sp. UNC438CL73TsuS30 TaxID=1340434 RepID=UPI00047D8625|nr:helix-turn-helix domain-containing protein [Bacillus sp. UNC438CL73TsuS30]
MKESTVDVILHPVRMRIIQCLINQQHTAQQLKELLRDIPQASLYRNIKKLAEAEIIHVIREIPNRGTIEKVYSIQNPNKSLIGPEEINTLPNDEQLGLFIKFMANLMAEFEQYLQQEKKDFAADGVTFRQASIYLSDEEFSEFAQDLVKVFSKVINNKPSKERRRRTVGTIIIPEKKNK